MRQQEPIAADQELDFTFVLDAEKKFHIHRALSEACYWGRAIERNQRKPSDQYWIETFSTGTATYKDVQRFFPTYQIHRAPWRFEDVVSQVNSLCKSPNWTVTEGIGELAASLPKALDNSKDGKSLQDGDRTSAASKIAMFARTDDDVFIWDRLAKIAMGVRAAKRSGTKKAVIYNARGLNGYDVFHEHCVLELEAERAKPEFSRAVSEFMNFTEFTRSRPDQKQLAGRTYFERRLFDKLLVCEGVRIEEIRESWKSG